MTTPSSPSVSVAGGTINHTAAIVGGVLGGVIGLGLTVALFIFFVHHSRKKSNPQDHSVTYQQSSNMMSASDQRNSLIQSSMSVPGSPGKVSVSCT